MTSRVICFGSAKGGAGKTVTVASIGTFLAALGKKVLLIDTDASTNGLTLLFLQDVLNAAIAKTRKPLGIYEIEPTDFWEDDLNNLWDDGPEVGFLLRSGVYLLPATFEFQDTENRPPQIYEKALSLVLKRARLHYDYILLDAQAGSDVYARIAMGRAISDSVVLVSEYDPMSAAGIERLKGIMGQDLSYVRTWVLMNKMLPEFVSSFSEFLEVAKYLSPIPWDADVVRAYARRNLPLDLDKGNTYTLAIMEAVRGLLGNDIQEAIDEWTRSRAEMIRTPIEHQYQDLERELAAILERVGNLRRRPSTVWRRLFLGTDPVSVSIERAQLKRRQEVIEEQLRELEMLRTADPETVLRRNREIPVRRKRPG